MSSTILLHIRAEKIFGPKASVFTSLNKSCDVVNTLGLVKIEALGLKPFSAKLAPFPR